MANSSMKRSNNLTLVTPGLMLQIQTVLLLLVVRAGSTRVSATASATSVGGTSADLTNMFQVMEEETKAWKRKMEELVLPDNKCDPDTLKNCAESNYNGCQSQLPFATCPGAENRILACGKGNVGGCSGLFDFTASKVSLAKSEQFNYWNNWIDETSNRLKDGICSSLPSDEWVDGTREASETYWNNYDVSPPWYHYGNDDGMFRMLPGSPEECKEGESEYDPRVRPWYVAASSGPKDIILVLDSSGSMENGGRIGIMKEAATRVINTLGVSDYFAVIEFEDFAQQIGGDLSEEGLGILQLANDENKKNVVNKVRGINPSGGTNFSSGFRLAFDTFKASVSAERSSGCHKAILFLTDGEMQDNRSSLFSLITSEMEKYSNDDRPVLFTYSFGSTADKTVPKDLACQFDGIWASVDDGGDLSKSMGAYYKYFAYGLSGEENDDFVAWVAPYEYSTTGELGTTASAPVYDRSVTPPVLVGVVGIDFSFAAMERDFGDEGERTRNDILSNIVERSAASCPKLDLTKCQLQSLREFGSGDESDDAALCNGITNEDGFPCETKPLKSHLCDNITNDNNAEEYPDDVWNNRLNQGRTYEEKVCCNVGAEPRMANDLTESELDDLICTERKVNIGLLFGISAGCLVAFLSCLVLALLKHRKNKKAAGSA